MYIKVVSDNFRLKEPAGNVGDNSVFLWMHKEEATWKLKCFKIPLNQEGNIRISGNLSHDSLL